MNNNQTLIDVALGQTPGDLAIVNARLLNVYTGEILELKLVREGKEAGQALAYLEDGTMVVVSDARDLIGKKASVRVTSILQTQSGRMIFGKLK